MRLRDLAGPLALALAAATGCSDDPVGAGDPIAVVAGSYSAEGAFGTVLLTTRTEGSEVVVDWLDRGASLLMELHGDGTTSGGLFVPGADEDGSDLDEDLTGTWTLFSDGTVGFEHEADTFIRDMRFAFEDGRLTGEDDFGGSTTIRVEMVRR